MNTNIPHTPQCAQVKSCWACTFDWNSPSRKHNAYTSAIAYEFAIEWIESRGKGFRIAEVWRALAEEHGFGPTNFAIANHAVRDLAAHGLIVCMRATNGRCGTASRCILWEVTRATP